MGLTVKSVGIHAIDNGLNLPKQSSDNKIIAIAGNPNVGKSTVFNGLTGLKQHTGNWPGKTVSSAQGTCHSDRFSYIFVDIPGTYSLMAHSAEEEVARNFICFGGADAVVVVCDATCLERNLNLVLQTLEITDRVVLCLNLMDEAARKKISLDRNLLSRRLGIPVVGTNARKKNQLKSLLDTLDREMSVPRAFYGSNHHITYCDAIEQALAILVPVISIPCKNRINPRWLSLRLLEKDSSLLKELNHYLGFSLLDLKSVQEAIHQAETILKTAGLDQDTLCDSMVASLTATAEVICKDAVKLTDSGYQDRDRRADRFLTSRLTGYPVMLALLAFVFWITIWGANYPSQWLSNWLFRLQPLLADWLSSIGVSSWLTSLLTDGVYRVSAWVICVMLPPMAIFFPLFTLLEDVGYLPRIAFNLDYPFKKCHSCGKQALTMAMGFGCNAAGVTGCRIIDSPRERLIAILTNSFVPCNGRFPTLIALITMFFIPILGKQSGNTIFSSVLAALFLTSLILLGILMTFLSSRLLSATILKGIGSSFTLELPPYRRPQIGKVILRSIFDRTLFVLGRAVVAAAPAGALIWIMANVTIQDISLLNYCSGFLDPFARLMGLDGVILMAFVLGLPANEIVLPIILMAYLSQGSILELSDLTTLKQLLISHGWTWATAICTCLFSLMHWPCATTLLTIKKETNSVKWTLLAILIPTIAGIIACMLFQFFITLFRFLL